MEHGDSLTGPQQCWVVTDKDHLAVDTADDYLHHVSGNDQLVDE